jgi:hypothetical protein
MAANQRCTFFSSGEVLHDGVRLPEDEAVVLEHRHFVIGIEPEELRLALLAFAEIDEHQLDRADQLRCRDRTAAPAQGIH